MYAAVVVMYVALFVDRLLLLDVSGWFLLVLTGSENISTVA